ncbi:unnamed protein product [Hydatigera taeniaeformis]|uniref:Uncharacterized protein n=1 Tax=Hydatigena taeniaeformis TaxID=6205 RepID=A0A3P7HLP9_HYDTA|nr:unnamed protein product [Hydatigera taeniaeformis]
MNFQVCSPSLIPCNKWTALSFVFSNSKGFFARPTLTVYVNVNRVFEGEFRYPTIKEDLLLFHYGGCPLWVEETCYSGLILRLPPKALDAKPSKGKGSGVWSSLGIGSRSVTSKKLPGLQQVSIGGEQLQWGPLNAFRGRLSYVAVFNDPASEAFIQWLVQGVLCIQAGARFIGTGSYSGCHEWNHVVCSPKANRIKRFEEIIFMLTIILHKSDYSSVSPIKKVSHQYPAQGEFFSNLDGSIA